MAENWWEDYPKATPDAVSRSQAATTQPTGQGSPVAPIVARPEDITAEDIEAARSGIPRQGGPLQVYVGREGPGDPGGLRSAVEDRLARERATGHTYSVNPDTGALRLHIGGQTFEPFNGPTPYLGPQGLRDPLAEATKQTFDPNAPEPQQPRHFLERDYSRPGEYLEPAERGAAEGLVYGVGGAAHGAAGATTRAVLDINRAASRFPAGAPSDEDIRALTSDVMSFAGNTAAAALPFSRPAGSVGTIVGRVGASRLERAGEPMASKVLDMAETMDAQLKQQGVTSGEKRYNAIRDATSKALNDVGDERVRGVELGKDGEWRVELRDDNMRLRQMPQSGRAYPLEDIVDHPAGLFRAYPELKTYTFEFRPANGMLPGNGAINYQTKNIWITDNTNPHDIPKIIVHELTHAGQKFEGFAGGSDPRRLDPYFPKDDNYLHPKAAAEMPDAVRQFQVNPTIANANRIRELGQYEAYYRQAGEGEGRVQELRQDMPLTKARSAGQGPRITALTQDVPYSSQLGFGKRSRSYPIEVKSEQGRAKEPTPAQREQLAREDNLGRKAQALAEGVAAMERNMKANDSSPEQIASALETRFGAQLGKVDPKDIENGTGWWRVGTDYQSGRKRYANFEWSREERQALADGIKQQLPLDEVAKRVSSVAGRPLTADNVTSARRNFGWPQGTQPRWHLTPAAKDWLVSKEAQEMPSRDLAKALKDKFGVDAHWATVFRWRRQLRQDKLKAAGLPMPGGSGNDEDRSRFWGGYL